jgi:hypothetical protein
MAIVIQAFILVATDDPSEAKNAVYAALNGAVFESDNPVLDFAIGVEQMDPKTYTDGAFVSMVPAAAFLHAANSALLPC